MKQHNTESYSDHQELSQLLPWYVNKTLQGNELKAIEAHLTVCLMCKRELVQLQKLAQAVNYEGSLDSAEQASFTRLKMRLQSQPQALNQPAGLSLKGNAVSGKVKQLNDSRKQRWANRAIAQPALAMAAAVLLSITLLMPRYAGNDVQLSNNFKTLSDGRQQEAVKTNEIRVVFAENVNQVQKNTILERIHGQFVSNNPTAQGVYTVRLDTDIAAKHLLDVIGLLKKDDNVIFAEPAYALLSSMHTEE
jgi:hypothetical protein